jgi:CHASE2 domain-containing sensor protein
MVAKAYPDLASSLPLHNNRFINFVGPNKSFQTKHIRDLMTLTDEEMTLIFHDKLVLIGPRSAISQDMHLTPFGDLDRRKMYGPDIHMNAISTILNGHSISKLSLTAQNVLIFSLAFILVLVFHIFQSPLGKLLPGVCLIIGHLFLAQ